MIMKIKLKPKMLGGEISVMIMVVLMAAYKALAKKQFNFVILRSARRF